MQAKRAYFRTRGGPTQGWGNVFRLASFARWAQKASDVRPTFLAEGPAEVAAYLVEQGFDVVKLGDGISVEVEAARLSELPLANACIVEMLDITVERQRLLRTCAERLVIFDDLCDHIYDADLVVCGQDLPSHANRALSAPDTRFLVGYDYFLSRPEFLGYADRERTHRKTLERVLVTFGGGRYDVAYLKTAHAIAKRERTRGRALQSTFVLGYADRPGLVRAIRAVLPNAAVLGGVSDLEQRLWDADVVVGSAGYTKLEAAITQTPQLIVSTQWHQIPLAATFAARTGATDMGYMAYVEVDALAQALESLEEPEERRRTAARARSVVDGRGFERVGAAIFGTASGESGCMQDVA